MDKTGKLMQNHLQNSPHSFPGPELPPSPKLSAAFPPRTSTAGLSPRQLGASFGGVPSQQQGFSGSFSNAATPLPGSFVAAPNAANLGNVNFMQQQLAGTMGFVPSQSIHGTGNSGFIPNVGVLPSQPVQGAQQMLPVVGYAFVPVVAHPYGSM